MGIAAAKAAGIPSILIENFTWDWIYENYLDNHPDLSSAIHDLRGWFDRADYRIQTAPVCLPIKGNLTTRPVSRKSSASTTALLPEPFGPQMTVFLPSGLSVRSQIPRTFRIAKFSSLIAFSPGPT